ncbi:MAG: D-alanine aminotransferase [Thiothrix nivea]|nr:MAG: D-alanine aminotransferase [Thiothrix nivea]
MMLAAIFHKKWLSKNLDVIGFQLHLQRMKNGLNEIGIPLPDISDEGWREIANQLIDRNEGDHFGVYFQISRGNEGKRFHGFPRHVKPTIFGMTIAIAKHGEPDRSQEEGLRCVTTQDLRWKRCQVKSTALLGNVLHFQYSYSQGMNECILYNDKHELTEASHSNVMIVKDGVVITPPLDNQILPGISRHITLASLRAEGSIPCEERIVTMDEVRNADEVWITNSSKQIAPVVELDGEPVGNGSIGPVWEKAKRIYNERCFDFN